MKVFASGAAGAFILLASAAAAQQPAQPPRPTIPALLNAGYDLKAVIPWQGPCGNQPANRSQVCNRELYFFQSPQKNMVFRCELGLWNGAKMVDCTPVN